MPGTDVFVGWPGGVVGVAVATGSNGVHSPSSLQNSSAVQTKLQQIRSKKSQIPEAQTLSSGSPSSSPQKSPSGSFGWQTPSSPTASQTPLTQSELQQKPSRQKVDLQSASSPQSSPISL